MAYNYLDAMVEDIKDVFDEYEWDTEDRDSLAEQMNDDLWTDDSVTGNGSGSYTFDSAKAYEYLKGDPDAMDYIRDLVYDFGIDAETVAEKFLDEDYEYWDVSIRCYLLGEAIGRALDELGY